MPEDHPRVGGEKHLPGWEPLSTVGSPPRGRGKVFKHRDALGEIGITPAWAGKSFRLFFGDTFFGDHPRVGGEKTKKIP